MANVKVDINEVQDALQLLPKNLRKKALRQAMRPAMKPVAAAARDNAPKESGDMAKSIKPKSAGRSTKFIGIDVQMGEGDFKGDSFYGAFQEYGTSKMPPKGFMRKAYDEKGEAAKADAIQKLWSIVHEQT